MEQVDGKILARGRPILWCKRKTIGVSVGDLSPDEARIHWECEPGDHRLAIFEVDVGTVDPPPSLLAPDRTTLHALATDLAALAETLERRRSELKITKADVATVTALSQAAAQASAQAATQEE